MGSAATKDGRRESVSICSICQETLTGKLARPSSCPTHFFHRHCLIEWATRKSFCPLDHTPFLEVVSLEGGRTLIQRFRSYTEDGRSQAAQLMRLANPVSKGIQCKFCMKTDETLELALTLDCKHVFHRKCVVRFVRKFRRCPADGCYNKNPVVVSEFEDKIVIPEKEDVHCDICEKGETGEEWATPDECKHYFHRRCLYEKAKENRRCPKEDCQEPMKFIICDYGDKIAVRRDRDETPFKCAICREYNNEKERVILVPCCHIFHRDCLLFRPRLSFYCRQEGCCEKIESLFTETGAIIIPSLDSTCSTYAKAMAGTSFMCFICREEDNEAERAKPASCGCEFHRECLMKFANESVGVFRCPNCRHEFSRIQCLFGDDLVLQEKAVPLTRQQSNYASVPDLSRASRAMNTLDWDRDVSDMRRANSHANLTGLN